jgi:uncharacterized membrane protein YfcA
MDSLVFFQFAIFLLSGFVHGLLGFGFPMVATPLLSLLLGVKEAVLLTLFPTMVSNAQVIKKSGNFRVIFSKYWLLFIFVIIGSFLGTSFLIKFDSQFYKLLLAFVILLYLNKDKLKISLKEVIQNNPKKMMIIFGFLSGIVSGLVNIMLPVLVIYVLEMNLKKEHSFTLMNFCFLSSKVTQIFIFGSYGNFSFNFAMFMIPVILISILGLILGEKIRKHINEELYKKMLIWLLWALSFYLIFDTFSY